MQNDVKQVDRDAVQDFHRIVAARLLFDIKNGTNTLEATGEDGDDLPQAFAAHRIAAEAAKDAEIAGLKHDLDRYMAIANAEVNESEALRKEVAALQARVAGLEGALGSAYYTLTYLEALEEDPLTKEAMKETRDEIDTVLAKDSNQ